MKCKTCKHIGMRTASEGNKLFYALECNRHGILASHFNELLENVKEKTGKDCTCYREAKAK